MAEAEVVKRGPRGRRRRGEQARATRRRVIAAASELFVAQGYGSTTLEEIAARAAVAVQTVYFHFGNKRSLLKEAVDVASVGDDEPVAVLDRPIIQRIRDEPDAHRALALWTEMSRDIYLRVAPIMQVVRDAAAADPDMAEQWQVNQTQRLTAHHELARILADKGALRPGLTTARATDILFALISPELYLLLTAQRHWTPDQWQHWITTTASNAILRPQDNPIPG